MGRYQTEAKGESTVIVGKLPTGGSVTIVVYDLSDGSSVSLDNGACSEIGSTGLYRWASTQITTPATVKTEYVYIMTDATSGEKDYGKFVVGGYVNNIDELLSTIDTVVDNIVADTNELQTDWADGGRLDLIVDALLVDTNALNDTKIPDTLSLANIKTQTTTALSDIDLDHLIQVTAGVEEPTDGSYLDQIMHKDAGQTFNSTTDSLEAIRDTAPLGTAMRGTDSAYTGTPPTAAAIRTEIDSNSTQLAAIITSLSRLLGLSYENAYQHTRVYSGSLLQSAKLDLYDSKANATSHDGTTGIVAKYTLSFTYTGNNLATMQVVRDS